MNDRFTSFETFPFWGWCGEPNFVTSNSDSVLDPANTPPPPAPTTPPATPIPVCVMSPRRGGCRLLMLFPLMPTSHPPILNNSSPPDPAVPPDPPPPCTILSSSFKPPLALDAWGSLPLFVRLIHDTFVPGLSALASWFNLNRPLLWWLYSINNTQRYIALCCNIQ